MRFKVEWFKLLYARDSVWILYAREEAGWQVSARSAAIIQWKVKVTA